MTVSLTRRSVLAAGTIAFVAPPLVWGGAAWAEGEAAAAPVLTYPRQVGDLELVALGDGYLELQFGPEVFLNVAPDVLEATITEAFVDPAVKQRLGVTAHLVRGGGRTLLIDSGTADLFGPTLGRVPAALAALGVAPEAIDAVLITHMHPDHIGGLLAAGAPAYPNATLHVSEADLAFWTDEGIAAQAPADFQPFFARASATAAAYGDRVMPFTGETEVLPGITTLALPGHTVGHTGYRLASGDAEVLVFGDAAHVAAVQFSHPAAAVVFDTDPNLAAATRAKLFDMLATDRLLVAGTHMPFPGFGHVARAGDAYAWIPEGWQYR